LGRPIATAAGKVAILLTAKITAIATMGIAKTKALSLYVHFPVAEQKEAIFPLAEAELFQAPRIFCPIFLSICFIKATSGHNS
jgi:hypothetical protein